MQMRWKVRPLLGNKVVKHDAKVATKKKLSAIAKAYASTYLAKATFWKAEMLAQQASLALFSLEDALITDPSLMTAEAPSTS
jgi:hypothetical protein